MRKQACEKIGKENVYSGVEDIPEDHLDFVICNLVLCIVLESETKRIVSNIKRVLNKKGFAFIIRPRILRGLIANIT